MILLLILFLFHPYQNPDKNVIAQNLLTQLEIGDAEYVEYLMSVEQLPYKPSNSICVLPVVTWDTVYVVDEKYGTKEESFKADLHVIEYDNKSYEVKRSHVMTQGVQSDAMGPWEIIIDTAPYQIQNNVRAIGVKIDYHTRSWDNLGYEDFYLLKPNGSLFEQVLHFNSSHYQSFRGSGCETRSEIYESKLIIDQSNVVNGYFPIISVTEFNRFISDEYCNDTLITRQFNQDLIFEDGRYDFWIKGNKRRDDRDEIDYDNLYKW